MVTSLGKSCSHLFIRILRGDSRAWFSNFDCVDHESLSFVAVFKIYIWYIDVIRVCYDKSKCISIGKKYRNSLLQI